MMKHIILISVCLGLISSLSALEITSRTCIVTSNSPDPVEKRSSIILAEHLEKVTGSAPVIFTEKEWDGKKSAILLGRTEFAEKNVTGYSGLEPERWYIKVLPEKDSVIITGGWPRGTLFGVYDFLEYAGFRYFDLKEKHIPSGKKITLPDDLTINKKPYFKRRFQYLGMFSPEQAAFSSWNKLNTDASLDEQYSELYTERQDGLCNTFYEYGKDFPEDKPEYFSLHKGIRLRPVAYYGPGQFCYSHPEVRQLLKEKLKSKVAADREMSRKKGVPPMQYYLLSINDCETKCECDGCLALAKKYSAYSGAHLDFINDIASAVPDVTVVTRVYMYLVDPPKGIKPASNVKLSFAILGVEFSAGIRDTMRPYTHPSNKRALNFLKAWHKIGGMYDIWDYQRIFGKSGNNILTNIPVITSDSKTYAEFGIQHFFSENEYGGWRGTSVPFTFQPLSVYVSAKMMEDPYRDSGELINDFMEKYYGSAGKTMKAYYDYLVKRQEEQKEPLGSTPFTQCAYLDLEFFHTADQFLSEAEKSVASDPERLRRVQQERFPVDIQLLKLWGSLKKKAEINDPLFNMAAISDRVKKQSEAVLQKYFPQDYIETMKAPQNEMIGKLLKDAEASMKTNELPLPPQFQGKNAVSIPAEKYIRVAGEQKLADDPEAAGGKAVIVNKWFRFDGKRELSALFSAAPKFGIQDRTRKVTVAERVLKKSEIPQDEKYHFHRIGVSKLKGDVIVFAHHTWYVQIPTNSAYSRENPEQLYEFWLSLKLEGPAYVKGSEKKNAFIVDRIVLIPIEKETIDYTLPAEFQNKGAVHIPSVKFTRVSSAQKLSDDEDAFGGKTMRIYRWLFGNRPAEELFKPAPQFGIQNRTLQVTVAKRVLKQEEIPQDEKYHFYYIGKSKLKGEVLAFAHGSWYIQIPVKEIFDPENPEKEYHFWISLKLEGPAYVKNSRKKNGFCVDRLVLIP